MRGKATGWLWCLSFQQAKLTFLSAPHSSGKKENTWYFQICNSMLLTSLLLMWHCWSLAQHSHTGAALSPMLAPVLETVSYTGFLFCAPAAKQSFLGSERKRSMCCWVGWHWSEPVALSCMGYKTLAYIFKKHFPAFRMQNISVKNLIQYFILTAQCW